MKDRILGCMVGGAVGDALGYPVEFLSLQQILARYGRPGIKRYELDRNGVAEISDDTQMTLFTAAGCLLGLTRYCMRGIMGSLYTYSYHTYLNWYYTQTHEISDLTPDVRIDTWLMRVPELYSRRAPGNTCMQALRSMMEGEEPQNNSCGCGGVMRTAPIALICARNAYADGNIAAINDQAVQAARLTHKHPLGFLPSGVLNQILYIILKQDISTREELKRVILGAAEEIINGVSEADQYKRYDELWSKDYVTLRNLIRKAVNLADGKEDDIDCIRQLGQGWTGHEALAIAVFCILRHWNSFEDAVVAAVNHDGDSDSTGAICGTIMGAFLGRAAIPACYTENLELLGVIEEIATDLYTGCPIGEYCTYDTPEKFRWDIIYTPEYRWMPKEKMLPAIKSGEYLKELGFNVELCLEEMKKNSNNQKS